MLNSTQKISQEHPHTVVIGEALMDIVSPANHPQDRTEIPGGSSANTAVTIGRLGRPVTLQTWLGQDERGHIIAKHLEESHVHITPESFGASRTPTATATIGSSGSATYIFDLEWAPHAPIAVSPKAQVVHAASIASVIEPGGEAVYDALKRASDHAVITYDPNIRPSIIGHSEGAVQKVTDFLAIADVVKLSDEDLEWLSANSGKKGEDTINELLFQHNPELIIVTRGNGGATAYHVDGGKIQHTNILPEDVDVADTIGAGDSFMGGIIDALWELGCVGIEGKNSLKNGGEETSRRIEYILKRASQIADVTVSRPGANPPWLSELS